MSSTYKLIDSGDYEKLEIIGGFKLIRPALGSPYKKSNPKLWEKHLSVTAQYSTRIRIAQT
jgi:hypothetical protein